MDDPRPRPAMQDERVQAIDEMARIAAQTLARHLQAAGFAVMRRPVADAPNSTSTPKAR